MDKINFVNNANPALSAENLNQLQDNIEKSFAIVTRITDTEINNLDKNGFFIIIGCTVGGESIYNGYLLNLISDSLYQAQFYLQTWGFDLQVYKLRFRKKVNGTWTEFTDV